MTPLSSDPRDVWSRNKRAERADLGLCINGRAKATNGVRCLRCTLVHRYGAALAHAMPEYEAAPACGSGNSPKRAP